MKRFGFVLLSFFKNTNVLFWFLGSLEQTKTFRFCSNYKRTKSKRFGFVPIVSFNIKMFVLSFRIADITLFSSNRQYGSYIPTCWYNRKVYTIFFISHNFPMRIICKVVGERVSLWAEEDDWILVVPVWLIFALLVFRGLTGLSFHRFFVLFYTH